MIALTELQGDPSWWACLAIVIGCPIYAAIRAFHKPTKQHARYGRHVSDRERELLGTSWFDSVAPYFGRRRELDERVARAVDHTCFPKEGDHAVVAADPVATHRGEEDEQHKNRI